MPAVVIPGQGNQTSPTPGGGVTGAPPPGAPRSIHANEPPVPGPQPPFAWGPAGSVIQLPDGGSIRVPQQGFTPEQFNALSGVRAGNPVGGPAAQAIIHQLIGEGFLVPGSSAAYGSPVGSGDPPPGAPRPGGAPANAPVYTQNRVTQEQFNEQVAQSAYQPMNAAQRWARLAAANAPPAPTPTAPVPPPGPTPLPGIPYEPPPIWGAPKPDAPPFYPGGGQGDEMNGPRPGTVIPRPPGPGQTLPGGGQTTTKPQTKGGPQPFYSNPQDAHAKALRTVLG